MAGFKNLAELAAAQDNGQYLYASFRKVASQVTLAGVWFDLSMSPGNPAPNYYIGTPYAFTPLRQSTDGGIRHGGNVAPKKKFLRKLMAISSEALAMPMLLCDYVGFYGFIDESAVGDTPTVNTIAPTRYVDTTPDFYGAELVSDPAVTFSGASYWVSDGVYRVYTPDGSYTAVRVAPIQAGVKYRLDLTIDEVTAGSTIVLEIGNGLEISIPAVAGAVSHQFCPTVTGTLGIKRASGVTDVQISGVSIREIKAPGAYPSLQLMPVVVAPHQGGQTFNVIYTNQDGVPGRVSQPALMSTQATVNGSVFHSYSAGGQSNGPFIPLQNGDTGVRSVEGIRINGTGDVGLFALVLVEPLATLPVFNNSGPVEVDYLTDSFSMPEIRDDAYLNLIALAPASLSGDSINGIIETTWG